MGYLRTAFLLFSTALFGQGIITTFAGTDPVFKPLPALAVNTPFGEIEHIAIAPNGNMYVVDWDQSIVVSISPSGAITLVAGNGIAGFSGDGGLATKAQLNHPDSVAVDSNGVIYIADSGNGRIRRIGPAGNINTFAGGGFGQNFENVNARSIPLFNPRGVVVDSAGSNIYFIDGNGRIRKVVQSTATITTIAGAIQPNTNGPGDGGPATSANFQNAAALFYDAPTGYFYVVDNGASTIRRFKEGGTISTYAGAGGDGYSGDGGAATKAQLHAPNGAFVDSGGNLYIGDSGNNVIRRVTPAGTISTFAGNGLPFGAVGDGGPATNAIFSSPRGVAVDSSGNIFVNDSENGRVRKIDASSGLVSTYAGNGLYSFGGDGGPAITALFNSPIAAAFDSAGNMFVADAGNNRIRKIDTAGNVSTFAGNGSTTSSGDGGQASQAGLPVPSGLAFDAAGNLYFAEFVTHRIRKVAPNGTITTFAGTGVAGFSGDGGDALKAQLYLPAFVSVDGQGNVYFVDFFNSRIRKVTQAGIISTVAGNGQTTTSGDNGPAISAGMSPGALTVTSAGVIYIGDGNRVRKVANGTITTVATLPLTPAGNMSIDGAGNVVACAGPESFDGAEVFSVSSAGTTVIAGTGARGFSGDGGAATAAKIRCFSTVLDSAGNLYLPDADQRRIRKVSSVAPSVVASPTSLTFTTVEGTSPASKQISVTGSSGASVAVSAGTQSGGNWLSVSPGSGLLPSAYTVAVDASALTAGTYQGTVTVQPAGAAIPISVTLTVTAAPPGQLFVFPGSVDFQVVSGSTTTSRQAITIGNSGGGSLNWSTTVATADGGSWLSVQPGTGSATLHSPATSSVVVNPQNLSAGAYSGTVTINPGGLVVKVRVLATAAGPSMRLAQSGVTFTAVQGGGVLPSQSINVINVGTGTMNWTAQVLAGKWLSVSPPNGGSGFLSPQAVQLTADATGLSVGPHYGLVQVSATGAANSPQYITALIIVLPATSRPGVAVYPLGSILISPQGSTGGIRNDTITLSTGSLNAVPLSVSSRVNSGSINWLTASARGGSVNPVAFVDIAADPKGLSAGVYAGTISLLFGDGTPSKDVSVVFVVTPSSSPEPQTIRAQSVSAPAATCTATKLVMVTRQLGSNFSSPVGWPVNLEVQITDDCGTVTNNATALATFSNGDAPLALVNAGNGIYSATWKPGNTASATKVTLQAFQSPLASATITLDGASTANATPPPSVGSGGVVNAASFASGQDVAPGAIISVFGTNLATSDGNQAGFPLPSTLGNIKITIGGVDAPLFYAGKGQVNAQVPFEAAPGSQVQVVARAVPNSGEEVSAVPEPLLIGAAHAGIFTTDGKQGAILDGVTNKLLDASNPATAGSIIVIFCTGLGATTPANVTGQAASSGVAVVQPTVTIGGSNAVVQYAGVAPGFVGLYQVNAVVPTGIPANGAVPVVITQKSVASNAGTIAVK